MSLQDKLDEYKKSFLETAPPEAVAVMQRATEDLKNSGILDKVLKVGDPAPDFSLPDVNGNLVALVGGHRLRMRFIKNTKNLMLWAKNICSPPSGWPAPKVLFPYSIRLHSI